MRLVLLGALAASCLLAAQGPPAPKYDVKGDAKPLGNVVPPVKPPDETVKTFNIYPSTLPKPALRFKLLPELKDLKAGNSIQGYMKCFAEQSALYYNKDAVAEREALLEMDLDLMPVEKNGWSYQQYGGSSSRNADLAARMDRVDWQLADEMRREGFATLLPDLQIMRNLAGVLRLRTRARVKAGDFVGAVYSIQTLMALGQHLGQHPSVIGTLVGVAVSSQGLMCLEEYATRPGAPNLFWAYQHMPKPAIDLRRAVEAERMMCDSSIGDRIDREEPMSKARLDKLLAHIQEVVSWGKKVDVAAYYADYVSKEGVIPAARKRLVEAGVSIETTGRMPPLQVVLLDDYEQLIAAIDDDLKLVSLPYPEYAKLANREPAVGLSPMLDVSSRLFKVRIAQNRLDRKLAMLQIVEAIRAYVADHEGALPPALAAIKLPLPLDPFTQKPFEYGIQEGKAVLRGPRFEGDALASLTRFEIVVGK